MKQTNNIIIFETAENTQLEFHLEQFFWLSLMSNQESQLHKINKILV